MSADLPALTILADRGLVIIGCERIDCRRELRSAISDDKNVGKRYDGEELRVSLGHNVKYFTMTSRWGSKDRREANRTCD